MAKGAGKWLIALACAVALNTTAVWWVPPIARWAKGRHGRFDETASLPQPRIELVMDGAMGAGFGNGLTVLTVFKDTPGKPSEDTLVLVDSAGRTVWRRVQAELSPFASPIIAPDGHIFAATLQGVVAYDLRGNLRWETRLDAQANGRIYPLSLAEGVLIAGGDPVRAVDPNTGRLLWEAKASSRFSVLIHTADAVYTGEYHVKAINKTTGEVLWEGPAGMDLKARTPSGLLIADRGYWGREVVAMDSNRHVLWTRTLESRMGGAAARDDNTIVVSGGALYAFGPDGSQIWKFRPPDIFDGQPYVRRDGSIVAATLNRLFAVRSDGKPKWMVVTGWDFGESVNVLVSPVDGSVYIQYGQGRNTLYRVMEER